MPTCSRTTAQQTHDNTVNCENLVRPPSRKDKFAVSVIFCNTEDICEKGGILFSVPAGDRYRVVG